VRNLSRVPVETLRSVVAALASIDRSPCSPGEKDAAEWLGRRLAEAGCDDVAIDQEPSWGRFPPTMAGLACTGGVAALATARGHRIVGPLAAAAVFGGMLDEIHNGPRLLRRAVRRRRSTVNVVASVGDVDSSQTLVVLAHHDAAQTSVVFDQRLVQALHRRGLGSVASFRGGPRVWWPVVAGPILTVAGGALRTRLLARAGLILSAGSLGFLTEMMLRRTVPGANDNLSGVAALVALAEMLRERPISGLRILLVSCGAEETLQDGIRAFIERHRTELTPERTCFLNLDTIGSSHLVMLEGEAPVWTEHYAGGQFRELVAACAADHGIEVVRAPRAGASTDGIIPSRAGIPTTTLISIEPWGLPANYHLMSDTPDTLDYATVADAARLVYAVAAALPTLTPAGDRAR
jgi:hypothetical protein